MQQLKELKKLTQPTEVLFVGNASIGQDTVNVAKKMDEEVQITGTVLTMLDGTARGGAAISIKEVTQKPIVFEGVGEKITDLQIFNPTSMADRILGMGDTINLVKKAKEHIDEDEAKRLEQKIKNATFSYDDYLKQIQSVKKMGSIKSLLKMLPAMPNMPSMDLMNLDDKEFFKVEAMILSMTKDERVEKSELSHSRRKRISQGSGTTMEDINKLVKSFKQAKQFFKNMPNMKQLEKMLGGSLWR